MSNINAANFGNYGGDYQVSADILLQAANKARLHMDGTGTISVDESINIASAVDNGTGDTSANLTSSFATAFYSLAGSALYLDDSHGVNPSSSGTAFEVGVCRFLTTSDTGAGSGGAAVDCTHVSIILAGDLA